MQAAGLESDGRPAPLIGVMGGMFDPVHNGHIAVALAALKALALDELRLIPCHLPNHRGPASASAQERLAMLRLAAAVDDRLRVDDRECLRPGVSYTVDTLESLRAEHETAVLVLIVGADAFAGLTGWHRWQEIFGLANVLVVSRPRAFATWPAALQEEVQQRQVSSGELLCAQTQGSVLLLQDLQWDISSTQVRE
ncbi:MAG: nicotinate (nicotinamide) nucleotide adenylyltransferase, partial [Gammaproteobacteria bacterium]|nr:nicotinate (nicotinamide) nucleotide adenylyltransferase [Gammaproteobacteria bacterium]